MEAHAVNDAFSLSGRRILITGGATGLGLAMARAVVASDGEVIITGRTEATLRSACESIGNRVHWVVNDIDRRDQIPVLLDNVETDYGPIYGVVSNAGNHLKKPALETGDEEFASIVDRHLFSGFALARESAKRMSTRGEGAILFICSMSAVFGLTNTPAYTAAKSALLGLTRELATELSPAGIRVNAIIPGFIESRMMRGAFANDPAREARVLSRTPMARIGEPEDIGNAAVFLLSRAARFITGTSLTVDGGMSIGF